MKKCFDCVNSCSIFVKNDYRGAAKLTVSVTEFNDGNCKNDTVNCYTSPGSWLRHVYWDHSNSGVSSVDFEFRDFFLLHWLPIKVKKPVRDVFRTFSGVLVQK